jgi:hypothetical protein
MLLLGLVMILANLAWGSLWNLAASIDWFRPLADGWPPARPANLLYLPYTRPDSAGGRLFHWLGDLAAWWRQVFWPTCGAALTGGLTSAVLALLLIVLLPRRVYPLSVVLVALIGLGLAQRRRGRESPTGQALVQIGLGWLAGHAAFAEVSVGSLAVALGYVLAASGALKAGKGGAGLGLLNFGQVSVVMLLAGLKQPLAAGGVGLLLFGQIAVQISLRFERVHVPGQARVPPWWWLWMMASMLVAALALP